LVSTATCLHLKAGITRGVETDIVVTKETKVNPTRIIGTGTSRTNNKTPLIPTLPITQDKVTEVDKALGVTREEAAAEDIEAEVKGITEAADHPMVTNNIRVTIADRIHSSNNHVTLDLMTQRISNTTPEDRIVSLINIQTTVHFIISSNCKITIHREIYTYT